MNLNEFYPYFYGTQRINTTFGEPQLFQCHHKADTFGLFLNITWFVIYILQYIL